MMRPYLLRHAKSSWKHPGLPDHDRPLAGRGAASGQAARSHLRGQGIDPQLEQGDLAADVAAAPGASVERHRHPFAPALGGGIAGLPTGRFLGASLVPGDDPLTTGHPGEGVPMLTDLERDLAAGWRGYA